MAKDKGTSLPWWKRKSIVIPTAVAAVAGGVGVEEFLRRNIPEAVQSIDKQFEEPAKALLEKAYGGKLPTNSIVKPLLDHEAPYERKLVGAMATIPYPEDKDVKRILITSNEKNALLVSDEYTDQGIDNPADIILLKEGKEIKLAEFARVKNRPTVFAGPGDYNVGEITAGRNRGRDHHPFVLENGAILNLDKTFVAAGGSIGIHASKGTSIILNARQVAGMTADPERVSNIGEVGPAGERLKNPLPALFILDNHPAWHYEIHLRGETDIICGQHSLHLGPELKAQEIEIFKKTVEKTKWQDKAEDQGKNPRER